LVQVERTTTIRPLDVVLAAEASTVMRDPIRVKTVGLATFAPVLQRDQTQETQSSMAEKSVLPAITVALDLTQRLLVRWVTTRARKEMGMLISVCHALRIPSAIW
jgi:hypothetical protein